MYNIRDMYPDMAVGGSIVRPGSFTAHWGRHASLGVATGVAARVIVLGEDMRDRIVAKGIDPARVVVSRDGIVIPETVPSPDNSVAREIRGDFRFALVHAGNLGFYGAANADFRGANAGERRRGPHLYRRGRHECRKCKPWPRAAAPFAFCRIVRQVKFRRCSLSGDMHVVTVKRGLEGVVVPSKLYPTLAAGRAGTGGRSRRMRCGARHSSNRLRHRRQSGRPGERCVSFHTRRVARHGTIAGDGGAGAGNFFFL